MYTYILGGVSASCDVNEPGLDIPIPEEPIIYLIICSVHPYKSPIRKISLSPIKPCHHWA